MSGGGAVDKGPGPELEWDFVRQAVAGRWIQRPGEATPCPTGVGTDTREPLQGRLFVALRGARHDGHDHLPAAAAAGARLLLVDRPPMPGAVPASTAVLAVEDTLRALQRLAEAHRRRLAATRVIGITGSVGKTTTRRLVDAVLGRRLDGVQSPRSFNNHIGVPLTLLSAALRHRYVVAEIGMNAPGEIAQLASIAEPDIGVVTAVGRAHLEGLGSVEAIAREKTQLLRHLREGGLAVANIDQPLVREHLRGLETLVTYGLAEDADVRLTGRRPAGEIDGRPAQELEVNGRQRFLLALSGAHNAVNALAAIVVARRLGLGEDAIAEGFAAIAPEGMRLEPEVLPTAPGLPPLWLINDAYNANPESMAAALDAFAELAPRGARRVLVLGDMLELGDASAALHRELAERLVELDRRAPLECAILVGPEMVAAAEFLRGRWGGDRVVHQLRLDAAAAVARLRPGDAVLLKASRGMALERVAEAARVRCWAESVTT